jgi:putative ABC transport system permease protein
MMTYIGSQLRYRAGRALMVVAAIALGAALFVALTALGDGYREAARAPLAGVAADLLISRPATGQEASASAQQTRGPRLPFGSAPLTSAEVGQIAAAGGVVQAAGVLEVWDFGATQYRTVLGLDLAQDQLGPARALNEGLLTGRLFQAGEQGVVVADRHYAAFFGLKPGDHVSIGDRSFEVVGVAEQRGSSQAGVANLYVPLSDAQALVGLPAGQVNQVYVRVADASRVDEVVAALTAQLGSLSAISQESILQVMGGVAQVSARFAQVAGLVGLLGGWVFAWIALAGLVTERQREIGVMKAVGWRARDVTHVFLVESLLLSVAGGLVGIALGLGVAWGLGFLPAPVTSLNETLPGLVVAAAPATDPLLAAHVAAGTLALALLVAVSGGVLAGWQSARRAAGLKPSQTLRKV